MLFPMAHVFCRRVYINFLLFTGLTMLRFRLWSARTTINVTTADSESAGGYFYLRGNK
jgi:hypothetical protein